MYHTQVLSENAKLLIVEEADTGDNNSDKYYLNEEDLERIKGQYEESNIYGSL